MKSQLSYEEQMRKIDEYFREVQPMFHTKEEIAKAKNSLNSAQNVLNYEKDLQSSITPNRSETFVNTKNLLSKEKYNKALRLGVMLYDEGKNIKESKSAIQAERDSIVDRMNNYMQYPEKEGSTSHQSLITNEQIEALKNLFEYLEQNHESIPAEMLSAIHKNHTIKAILDYNKKHGKDILHKEQILTPEVLINSAESSLSHSHQKVMEELAKGYEHLLECLSRRENILEKRLDTLLKDYGKTGRILQDQKDFDNEIEDIDYDFNNLTKYELRMEDIISLSEQLNNPHFRDKDLFYTKLTQKTLPMTTLRFPKKGVNINKTEFKNARNIPHEFKEDYIDELKMNMNSRRIVMDLPMDEVYHREKAVIDNVTRAQRELEEAKRKAEQELTRHSGSIEHLFDGDIQAVLENEESLRRFLKSQEFSNENGSDQASDMFMNVKTVGNRYLEAAKSCLNSISGGEIEKFEDYVTAHSNLVNLGY